MTQHTANIASALGGLTPSLNIGMINAILWLFGIAIVLMILYFTQQHKLWPIRVLVTRRTGGGFLDIIDDGKIEHVDGSDQLRVAGIKKSAPRPENHHLIPTRGLFKKWSVHMYQNSSGDLVPFTVNVGEHEATKVARQIDMEQWAQLQRKRVRAKYINDFWNKYGTLVANLGIVTALIIVTFIIMQKYVEASEVLASAMREAATIIQTMK